MTETQPQTVGGELPPHNDRLPPNRTHQSVRDQVDMMGNVQPDPDIIAQQQREQVSAVMAASMPAVDSQLRVSDQAQAHQRRLHRPCPASPPQLRLWPVVASVAGASLWTGLCLALAPPSPSLGMLLWGLGAQLGLTALTWAWRPHHALPTPASAPRLWPHLLVQALCLLVAVALGLWLGSVATPLTCLSAGLLCAAGLCLPTLALQTQALKRQFAHWRSHKRQLAWEASTRRINAAHRDLHRFQEHERPQALALAIATATALRQAP